MLNALLTSTWLKMKPMSAILIDWNSLSCVFYKSDLRLRTMHKKKEKEEGHRKEYDKEEKDRKEYDKE